MAHWPMAININYDECQRLFRAVSINDDRNDDERN